MEKKRWGSDWDIDLGWVLVWLVIAVMIGSIAWAISWGIVRTNDRNNRKEEVIVQRCKQVTATYIGSNSQRALECK